MNLLKCVSAGLFWLSYSKSSLVRYFRRTLLLPNFVSVIYLLIVFAVYASKQDALEKKAKAKKLREKNARKFLEEQQLNEEKLKQEQATTEAVAE